MEATHTVTNNDLNNDFTTVIVQSIPHTPPTTRVSLVKRNVTQLYASPLPSLLFVVLPSSVSLLPNWLSTPFHVPFHRAFTWISSVPPLCHKTGFLIVNIEI